MKARNFKDTVYKEVSDLASAMADPRRLEILDLLTQSEKNVSTLAAEMDMTVANVSYHLQTMKGQGLISDRQQGRSVFYTAEAAGREAWRKLAAAAENLSSIQKAMQNYFGEAEIRRSNLSELVRKVRKKEIILVDVRPDYEYEADHIPGAISMPLAELKQRLKELPKNKTVLAYCRGPYCGLSHEAVKILKASGLRADRLAESVVDYREMYPNSARTEPSSGKKTRTVEKKAAKKSMSRPVKKSAK